jgi:hypothetical protein
MPRLTSIQKSLLPRLVAILCFVVLMGAYGTTIDHSKITQVVNDVSVINPDSMNGRPAKPDDVFHSPDIMKTGAGSRSEMVADDQTITRVGANTLFSFQPKERIINLKQGSVLFQSPTGKGGGTIRTAAATASVLGTTIIVVATKDGGFKLMVLEGKAKLTMPDGTVIFVRGGQLAVVPPGSGKPGPVIDFLLRDEVQTSLLVAGFNDQLPSWKKIWKTILKQDEEIALGQLVLPTYLRGNIINPNTLLNNIQGSHVNFPRPVIIPLPTPRIITTVIQQPTPIRQPTPPRNPTGTGGP